MVGIVALTSGTTACAATHEIHRGRLKSLPEAKTVPSAAVRPDTEVPAQASPLGIAKVRLDSPPPGEENSAVLKFQLSNRGSNTLTDIVFEVVIVEEREREQRPNTPIRIIAGPFVIRGTFVLDPGYTADCELLLRNISSTCSCAANVRVLSFRSVIQARNGGFRLRLLKSDVRVIAAMMYTLLLQLT